MTATVTPSQSGITRRRTASMQSSDIDDPADPVRPAEDHLGARQPGHEPDGQQRQVDRRVGEREALELLERHPRRPSSCAMPAQLLVRLRRPGGGVGRPPGVRVVLGVARDLGPVGAATPGRSASPAGSAGRRAPRPPAARARPTTPPRARARARARDPRRPRPRRRRRAPSARPRSRPSPRAGRRASGRRRRAPRTAPRASPARRRRPAAAPSASAAARRSARRRRPRSRRAGRRQPSCDGEPRSSSAAIAASACAARSGAGSKRSSRQRVATWSVRPGAAREDAGLRLGYSAASAQDDVPARARVAIAALGGHDQDRVS